MTDSEIIERIYTLDNCSENNINWINECDSISKIIHKKNFTNKSLIRSVILSLENESYKTYLIKSTGLFFNYNITI